MAITEMSLPIDIPWKRMGVSRDMIDPTAGDLQFPEKWRSSIAVFYHEPPELPPDYCNRKVTYLKIVCTLANYQLPLPWRLRFLGAAEGEDVSVLDEMRQKFADFYAWKDFDARITDSYPCYGALLQVGVYPHPADGVELHNFPYIAAYQPRKREMYETTTESGEILSQSASNLNVTKGTTSTNTNENYDLQMGGGSSSGINVDFANLRNFSYLSDTDVRFRDWLRSAGSTADTEIGGQARSLGAPKYAQSAPQEQVGTIKRDQRQLQDVKTTDISREKRESLSHTTTLNQLYSLLQSYHLGTNRAMYFMQPRPHVQDSKFTFVRGLRRLEGVQEFFMVINRPASVPGICVEVALETAHRYAQRAYQPRIIPLSDLYNQANLQKTADALGIDLSVSPYALYHRRVTSWNALSSLSRGIAYEIVNGGAVRWDSIEGDLRDTFGANSGERIDDVFWIAANVPNAVLGDVALLFEEYKADSGSVFITGRRLCSCVTSGTQDNQDSGSGSIGGESASGESTSETVTSGSSSDATPTPSDDTLADCENSSAEHISTCDDQPWVIYEKPYQGPSRPGRDGISIYGGTVSAEVETTAGKVNSELEDIHEILGNSLGSPERRSYGEGSLLDTEFILDDLAQMVRLLVKAGCKNLPCSDLGEARFHNETLVEENQPIVNFRNEFIRRSRNKQILELAQLSTSGIAKELKIGQAAARKVRRELLISALRSIDENEIDVNAVQENPIVERLTSQYSEERLRSIESSAGLLSEEQQRERNRRAMEVLRYRNPSTRNS